MTQKIIALVGISGVGKTTFLKKIARTIDIQHLTAGSLIALGKKQDISNRDSLRYSNIDENQAFLISGFDRSIDKNKPYVFMDGHVVIDNGLNLEKIDSNVFKSLKIDAMIHLVAKPEQIAENRMSDTSRKRPSISPLELSKHQKVSISVALSISQELNIPFLELKQDESYKLESFLLGN